MKALIAVAVAGMLVGVALDRRAPREAMPVVAVGPIEAPVLPPRIRAENAHSADVTVWYAGAEDGAPLRLGTVPPMATVTFPLPAGAGPGRIVLEAGAARFVSQEVAGGADMDVGLEVGSPIEQSRVQVLRLEVVRALDGR
jgi:streptogramin lyase